MEIPKIRQVRVGSHDQWQPLLELGDKADDYVPSTDGLGVASPIKNTQRLANF